MRVPASKYMRVIARRWLGDWWWCFVLPVAVCVALMAWLPDVRWGLAALLIVVAAMPLALALLYFYYGLAPAARWSVMNKEVALTDEGVTLRFTPLSDNEDEAPTSEKKCHIAWGDVAEIVYNEEYVLLFVGRYEALMLPRSVANPDVLQSLWQGSSR